MTYRLPQNAYPEPRTLGIIMPNNHVHEAQIDVSMGDGEMKLEIVLPVEIRSHILRLIDEQALMGLVFRAEPAVPKQ